MLLTFQVKKISLALERYRVGITKDLNMDSINGNATNIKEETVDHSYDLGHGISSELTNNSNSEIIRPLHLFSHHDARNLARSNDILNNASKLSITTGNYFNQEDIDKIKIKTEQNSDAICRNLEQESIFNNDQNIKIEKISNTNAAKKSTDDTQTDTKTTDSFQDLSVSGVDGQNENSTGSTSNVFLEFWEVDKSEMSCNIVKESSQLIGHKVNENEISLETKQKENVTSASDILKNRRTNLKQNPPKRSDKTSSTPDKCTSETLKNTTEKLLSEKALPSILKHRRKVNIIYKNISEPTQTKVPKGSFAPMKIKAITKEDQRIFQGGLGKVQNYRETDSLLIDKANRGAVNQEVNQQTASDPFVPEGIVLYSESFDHATPRIVQQNDMRSKGFKPMTKVEQQILQNGIAIVQNDQMTNKVLLDNVSRSAVNQEMSTQTSSDSSFPCHARIEMYSESFDRDTPSIVQHNDIRSKDPKPITKVEQRPLQNGLGKSQNDQITNEAVLANANKRADNKAVSQQTSSYSSVPCHERTAMYSESSDHDTPLIYQNKDLRSKYFNLITKVEKRNLQNRLEITKQVLLDNGNIHAVNQEVSQPTSSDSFVPSPERIEMYSESFDHDTPRIVQQNDIGSNKFKSNRILYVENKTLKKDIGDKNKRKDLQIARSNILPENAPANANKTTLPIQNLPEAPATNLLSPINNPFQQANLDKHTANQDANQSPLQFLPSALSHSSLQNCIVLMDQNQSCSVIPDNSLTTMQPITYIPLIVPLESVPFATSLTPLPLGSIPFPVSSSHSNTVPISNENLQQIAVEQRLNTASDVMVVNRSPVNPTIHDVAVRESSTQSSLFKAGTNTREENIGDLSVCEIVGTPQHTNCETLQKIKNNGIQEQLLRPKINWKNLRRSKYLGNTGRPYKPIEGISRVRVDETMGTVQQINYETQQKANKNRIQEPRPKINWKNLRRPKYLGNTRMRKTPFLNRIPGKKRKYTITNPLVLERLRRCCADRYKTPMPSDVILDGSEVESPDLNIVVESVYSLSHETDRAKDDLLHCKWFLKRQHSYFMNKFKRKMKLFGISNRKEFTDPKLSAPCLVVLDSLPNCQERTLRKCRQTRKIYTKKIEACTHQCRDK
ncbi:unnamed protein product [Mytilus edulis]|uniref:Uncharacterized protein n=1 Tax=Mytilus edulis TaxID=6550 RepID=A0A8S3RYY7_MYTED|nr:unnamed protein product [Mytilus edulis]